MGRGGRGSLSPSGGPACGPESRHLLCLAEDADRLCHLPGDCVACEGEFLAGLWCSKSQVYVAQ